MRRPDRYIFSNFLPFDTPVKHKGVIYKTPEHMYQALKTLSMKERREVAAAATPAKAKIAGGKVTLRENWDDIKLDVMESVQRIRFAPETSWHKKLIHNNELLIEWNSWHDRFWGRCVCWECKGAGANHLGRIHMKLRNEFK